MTYETYNFLNETISEAEAEGIEKDYTDKSAELKIYLDEMLTVYSSLKTKLGATWTQLTPLMVALELKNNEYLTKNFVLLPDEVKTMISYDSLKSLGSSK